MTRAPGKAINYLKMISKTFHLMGLTRRVGICCRELSELAYMKVMAVRVGEPGLAMLIKGQNGIKNTKEQITMHARTYKQVPDRGWSNDQLCEGVTASSETGGGNNGAGGMRHR